VSNLAQTFFFSPAKFLVSAWLTGGFSPQITNVEHVSKHARAINSKTKGGELK